MKRPDYTPELGFLLERPPVQRLKPKSEFLLRLEAKQGNVEAYAELERRMAADVFKAQEMTAPAKRADPMSRVSWALLPRLKQ